MLDHDHVSIRELIKRYNLSTDPIEKEILMSKIEMVKAEIDRQMFIVSCG